MLRWERYFSCALLLVVLFPTSLVTVEFPYIIMMSLTMKKIVLWQHLEGLSGCEIERK